ncbi:hypothetical protein D3C87_1379880 [compost metagenome]
MRGDLLQHRIEHRQLLMLAHRGGFAGGATDNQAVDAFFQQVADQTLQADEIDGAVVERRDERNPDTLKR